MTYPSESNINSSVPHIYVKSWMALALLLYSVDQIERYAGWTIFLLPCMILCFLGLSIAGLIKVVTSVLRRQWRRLIFILAAPAIFFLIALVMSLGFDSDWLRFQLARPYYNWVVDHLPAEKEGKMMWGFGSRGHFLSRIETHALVYDRSDRAAKQPKADEASEIIIRPLGGHFYLMTEIY